MADCPCRSNALFLSKFQTFQGPERHGRFQSSSTPVVAADEAPPRRRFRPTLPILLAILLIDSAYLFLANHASGPPRIPLSAFAYEACCCSISDWDCLRSGRSPHALRR